VTLICRASRFSGQAVTAFLLAKLNSIEGHSYLCLSASVRHTAASAGIVKNPSEQPNSWIEARTDRLINLLQIRAINSIHLLDMRD
jgi:hypothetical protein